MSEHNKSASASLGGPAPQNAGSWWCPDRAETPPQSAAETENTETTGKPFAMPDSVGAQFAALRGYWNLLKRGKADIPFTDDISFAALDKMAADVALVHVFKNPQRFRFDMTGPNVARVYGEKLENRFADEVSSRAPLDYFVAQCATTVESAAPTLYDHPYIGGGAEYQRLMLPLWGDGRVNAILAVFDIGGRPDAD